MEKRTSDPIRDPVLVNKILAKTSVDLGPNGMTQNDLDYAEQNGWEFVEREFGEHWFKRTFYGDNEVVVAQFFGRGQWGYRCVQPDRVPPDPEKGKRYLRSGKSSKSPFLSMLSADVRMQRAHETGELAWDWD